MSIGRKKILWVDNEVEFYRSQIIFLETRGYSVIPVFSSVELLELFSNNENIADLLLIDDKVDGSDSITIISEIRKICPNLPIVLITQNDSEFRKKSTQTVDAYINKPFTTSQFLTVCKTLLSPSRKATPQTKEAFVRSYSEIRTALSGNINLKDYYRIYEKLVYWEMELENFGDEGLRQALAGIKSDVSIAFSDFIVGNYGLWINDQLETPLLGYRVIEKEIIPLLNKNKKCILLVLSGMRFDQYLLVEQALNKSFNVKRHYALSTLPSAEEFSRNAFFAGELPFQTASRFPGLLKESMDDKDELNPNRLEDLLLYKNLSKTGDLVSDQEPYYSVIKHSDDSSSILDKIKACQKSQLVSLVLDLDEHIRCSNFSAQEQSSFQCDESIRRLLTEIWFQKSELFKVIQKIDSKDTTLVITSDHGSVLCNRATEIYNSEQLLKNRRYKYGLDISADERRVVFISNPSHFGLPSLGEQTNCIIAKENYYFSHPEKYEFCNKEYRACFQKGGISLEEMVMPLGIFQLKED